MSQKISKIVIPVAGVGTRGLPFTKEVPKELLPIIDIPAIHFVVEEAVNSGISQIVFVTAKGKSAIEDYFDYSPALEDFLRRCDKAQWADRLKQIAEMCDVISVRQKKPLGLGHAVFCARNIVGREPFAVALGDEIYPDWDNRTSALKQLTTSFDHLGTSVIGVKEVPIEDTSKYGIVDPNPNSLADEPVRISQAIEKPAPDKAPSCYAITGRYVFESNIFEKINMITPGSGGEIQLTDAIDSLAKEGRMYAQRISAHRYDVGSQFSYVQAQIEFALRRSDLKEKMKQYLREL